MAVRETVLVVDDEELNRDALSRRLERSGFHRTAPRWRNIPHGAIDGPCLVQPEISGQKNMGGARFRRQAPIGKYIADFACYEPKLIIELDGGQHANRIDYDDQRSLFLEKRGFKVIRFWNNDVIENIEGVLEAIHLVILEIMERTE